MILLLNSMAHLLVDGLCAATIFGQIEEGRAFLLLLYSTLAFSTQCLVGLWADRMRHVRHLEAVSALLLVLGYVLPVSALLKIILIGAGNSGFHVAGGVMTLRESGGKAAKLGVFVSPGAVGLTLGTLYPKLGAAFAVALVATVGMVVVAEKEAEARTDLAVKEAEAQTGLGVKGTEEQTGLAVKGAEEQTGLAVKGTEARTELAAKGTEARAELAAKGTEAQAELETVQAEKSDAPVPEILPVLLLISAVAVRAIGGTAVRFPWKHGAAGALLMTAFVAGGKTAGGYLCDSIGYQKAALFSLIPASILIACCSSWAIPSLLGQFALNLTMPVTLWLLYRSMPDSPGLSFGLAAAALWPGTIAGRLIQLMGPLLGILVMGSFLYGLVAILYSGKRIKGVQ